MVTQNHFVIPATVLEKFRSRGFPEGVTETAQDFIGMKNCTQITAYTCHDFVDQKITRTKYDIHVELNMHTALYICLEFGVNGIYHSESMSNTTFHENQREPLRW